LQTPASGKQPADKEPASPRGNRVIRLQIIRGDGSKTEVGVYQDGTRRGAVPKKQQERRGEGGGQSREAQG